MGGRVPAATGAATVMVVSGRDRVAKPSQAGGSGAAKAPDDTIIVTMDAARGEGGLACMRTQSRVDGQAQSVTLAAAGLSMDGQSRGEKTLGHLRKRRAALRQALPLAPLLIVTQRCQVLEHQSPVLRRDEAFFLQPFQGKADALP